MGRPGVFCKYKCCMYVITVHTYTALLEKTNVLHRLFIKQCASYVGFSDRALYELFNNRSKNRSLSGMPHTLAFSNRAVYAHCVMAYNHKLDIFKTLILYLYIVNLFLVWGKINGKLYKPSDIYQRNSHSKP